MICQCVGLALKVLHDALTSRLCIIGNVLEVLPQAEVPAKGNLEQICKMGITNYQDLTSLTPEFKGIQHKLVELWLLMLTLRAGEGKIVQPKPSRRGPGTTQGWQVFV